MQITEEIIDDFVAHLLDGDKQQANQMVQALKEAGCSVKTIYADLFQHALYQVGELWEANEISVASEHLATSITEALMNTLYPDIFSSEYTGNSAIVSCVANEYHQIGGKMVADTFEMNGWNGYFLGANTPVFDLIRMIDQKKPNLLALSLSIYFNMPNLISSIRQIRHSFNDLPILVGGQAFRWGGKNTVNQFSFVEHLTSLDDLEEYITTW